MATHCGIVQRTEHLSPTMIRVVLGGDGLAGFEPTEHTDQYVNALFVPEGAAYAAPFDAESVAAFPPEFKPRGRRYTIRRWDAGRREVTIDFVTHGDIGFAGRWAQRARPGDALQITGPSGGYAPDPDADWYLMAGDESALPAIAASLEVVPEGRRCVALIVVDDAECEQALASPGDLDLVWLRRADSSDATQLLADAVAALDFPPGRPDVFVHGEAGEIRRVRKHLIAERGLERDAMSISPYWRRAHDDEAWRAVKRDWLTQVAQDA